MANTILCFFIPLLLVVAAQRMPAVSSAANVTTVGAEVLVANGYAALLPTGPAVRRPSRVAIVADPTSVLPSTAEHLVDRMWRDGFGSASSHFPDLVVFGPEHGFRGDQQAGSGGGRAKYVDNRTGFTVYNTYGLSRTALAQVIQNSRVDAILFDIQDVGSRFYTFIWTMYDLMGAAADAAAAAWGDGGPRSPFPFLVLDRPNPLSGLAVRGPMNPTQTSFVGRANIPLMHGLTVAELARLFWGEFLQSKNHSGANSLLNVTAVPMRNWTRDMSWEDTGLPWILASPNMPTLDTVRVYPGMCLLEGTTMSEGRGTTRPFNLVGAPFLSWTFAAALRELQHNASSACKGGGGGYLYREAFFTPTFNKWAGNVSSGVDILLTPPCQCATRGAAGLVLEPMQVALEVLTTARAQGRDASPGFEWLAGGQHVDLLTGGNYTRLAIDRGESVAAILQVHADELMQSGFEAGVRPKYMLPEYAPAVPHRATVQ